MDQERAAAAMRELLSCSDVACQAAQVRVVWDDLLAKIRDMSPKDRQQLGVSKEELDCADQLLSKVWERSRDLKLRRTASVTLRQENPPESILSFADLEAAWARVESRLGTAPRGSTDAEN